MSSHTPFPIVPETPLLVVLRYDGQLRETRHLKWIGICHNQLKLWSQRSHVEGVLRNNIRAKHAGL